MLHGKSFEEVVKASKQNPHANWSVLWTRLEQVHDFPEHAVNRIFGGFAEIYAPLSRKFAADDAFFCIGSCFARNLEEQMAKRALNPITRKLSLQLVQREPELFARHQHTLPNQFLNRYNVPSMAQVIDDMLHDNLGDRLLYGSRSGDYVDLHFLRAIHPLPIEDSRRRRQAVRDMYRRAFDEAAAFVFTLGLCESFYDVDDDAYLNVTPDLRIVAGRRVEFRFNDVTTNVFHLRRIIDLIRRHKPEAEIIFTVSPVPLDYTFSGIDIVSANMLAKSTLLCSIFEAISGNEKCHYYPSYETVMYSAPVSAWKIDKKHVADEMVAHIISNFIEQNFETVRALEPAHA